MKGQHESTITCDIAIIGSGISALGATQRLQESFTGTVCMIGEHSSSMVTHGAWDATLWDGSHEGAETSESTDLWQDSVVRLFPDSLTYHPVVLADGWGQLYSTTLAQHAHKSGDLTSYVQDTTSNRKVGLLQLGDTTISPYPAKEYNQRWSVNREVFVDVHVPLTLATACPFALSEQLFGNEKKLSSFLTSLTEKTKDCDLLLCPPIFGVSQAQDRLGMVKEALDCEVAELLSTHPSPAGLRLHRALNEWKEKLSHPIIHGKVLESEVVSNRIQSLVAQRISGERVIISPRQVLLCTGDGGSGGIVSNEDGTRFFEPIFQVPAYQQSPSNPDCLVHGIAVNHACQPMDENKNRIADNLFAGGKVVGQWSQGIQDNALQQKDNLLRTASPPHGTLAASFVQGYIAAGFAVQMATSLTGQRA